MYPQENAERVIIKHPAYFDNNDLLTFYAWDCGSGIHLGMVLLACRLIACNEFDGFLTKDRKGTEQITDPESSLLAPGEYFFHVRPPQPEIYEYPIYPSFKHWSYPHNKVPYSWVGSWTKTSAPQGLGEISNSDVSLAVINRDRKCCVSGFDDELQRAHLCPQTEKEWFYKNDMQEYNSNISLSRRSLIDDKANSISLRCDIHQSFNRGNFVIVRKDGSWVAHFLKLTNSLGRMYHDRKVHVNAAVSPHFLLVRFAWALFPFMTNIFTTDKNRFVRLKVPDEGNSEVNERDYKLSGWSIGETMEKKNTGNKKRKNDDGQQDADGLEVILKAVPTSKQGQKCQLPQPSTCFDSFNDTSVSVSSKAPSLTRDSEETILSPPIRTITRPRRTSAFDRYIDELKMQALLKQRPRNPMLLCCDYETADKEADLGLPRNLCDECLGEEFMVMPEDP